MNTPCSWIIMVLTYRYIYPCTVALLTDEQLKDLEVGRIGERAVLRSRCKTYVIPKAEIAFS